MKELMEYREKLILRLGEAAREFCALCSSLADPRTNAGGGWTPHQCASHARDVERTVYGMRIRRTLNETNPLFESFDPDGWMASHYNRDEPLQGILGEFAADVDESCRLLTDLPAEGWSRVSCHESLGGDLTLQLWVERSLAHIEEHLAALKPSN